MREINSKFVLSKKNNLGIYRGCTNLCMFCPSRSRLAGQKDFTDTGIKKNSFELLEMGLRGKRKKCMIHTDLISEPYQKLEADKKIIRGCLEILRDQRFGVDITTKNELIRRDLDLIEEINYNTKAVVQINFMTINDNLSKKLEPNALITSERLKLVKDLLNLKIPVIVLVKPILPFINDSREEFEELLTTLINLNPTGLLCKGFGVKARKTTKEFFYKKLESEFNNLNLKYEAKFGDAFILESPNAEILNLIYEEKIANSNMLTDYNEIGRFLRKYENREIGTQLKFF